ncbi:MAG: hypothetical protein V1904_07680 [Bacteroidota bacterium]
MKTALSILLTAATILFFSTNTNAQKKKNFQGTITYNITYPGANITPAMKAQLPTTQDVTVKDCKSKTEMITGAVTQASITDGTAKTKIVLIDYMGTKYSLKLTSAEIAESLAKDSMPVITTTSDTKVIAGYTCKKAILATTDEDGTITNDTIYYSDEIGCSDLNFDTPFKDIPGAVLEYSIYIDQINANMKYTAKEVKKEKVSDNLFLIPSDYQEVTMEEFKKVFGGE